LDDIKEFKRRGCTGLWSRLRLGCFDCYQHMFDDILILKLSKTGARQGDHKDRDNVLASAAFCAAYD
jgi:hypothetical protein